MAKWGFLKNIVNIDRFFASGTGGEEAKEETKDAKLSQAPQLKVDEKEESMNASEKPKVESTEKAQDLKQEDADKKEDEAIA